MQLLIIKLTSPDATPVSASISNKTPESQFNETNWDTLRQQQRGHKVVLLIPDSDVSLAETHIPSKNKKQMLQALPFALEESLAEDVDKLHFSAYRETEESPVKAAIINHDRLGFWIDLLKSHDINTHYVLPALFALPTVDQGWSIHISDEDAQIRQSTFSGFACPIDVLDYLLPSELETHAPEALYVSGDSLRVTRSLQGQDVEIRAGNAPSLVQLEDLLPTLPLNLLNNYSRGESALTGINWSPWKPVAAISGLLLVTWLTIFIWQNQHAETKLNQLESEISKVYRDTVPNGTLNDPDTQLASMTSLLAQLQGSSTAASVSPLPTIAKVAPVLKQFSKMTVKELAFKRNTLQVRVEAPNLGMLDQFQKAAEKSQLSVNIGSSKTTANNVASTLIIKEAI